MKNNKIETFEDWMNDFRTYETKIKNPFLKKSAGIEKYYKIYWEAAFGEDGDDDWEKMEEPFVEYGETNIFVAGDVEMNDGLAFDVLTRGSKYANTAEGWAPNEIVWFCWKRRFHVETEILGEEWNSDRCPQCRHGYSFTLAGKTHTVCQLPYFLFLLRCRASSKMVD